MANPVRLTSAAMLGGSAEAQGVGGAVFIQGTFDLSSSAAPRSPDIDVPAVALFDDDMRSLTAADNDSPAVGAMPPSGDHDVDTDKDKKNRDKDGDNDSSGGSKSGPGDNDNGGGTTGGGTGGGTTGGGTTGGGTTGGGTTGSGGGPTGSPTPEPASMLLLGTGLAAAWQSRRLRRDR